MSHLRYLSIFSSLEMKYNVRGGSVEGGREWERVFSTDRHLNVNVG